MPPVNLTATGPARPRHAAGCPLCRTPGRGGAARSALFRDRASLEPRSTIPMAASDSGTGAAPSSRFPLTNPVV